METKNHKVTAILLVVIVGHKVCEVILGVEAASNYYWVLEIARIICGLG